MEMAGGAVGRRALVIVKEVNLHGAVGGEIIPDGRGVLEAGVDESERGAVGCYGGSGIGGPW